MSEVTYRWIHGPTAPEAEWDRIDMMMAMRGWPQLYRGTTRVLVAEDAEGICGAICLQMLPHTEPLIVERRVYGKGVAEGLADRMVAMLTELRVAGYMVVAENPLAVKLCEDHGFKRVECPVYVGGA